MNTKTFVGLVVLAVVLLYLFVPAAMKLNKLKSQKSELQQDIQSLSAKNQVLENELRLLKEDPVYREYIARKTFKRAKEGEIVYKFVSPEEVAKK